MSSEVPVGAVVFSSESLRIHNCRLNSCASGGERWVVGSQCTFPTAKHLQGGAKVEE